ncbi:MAG: hypothetical protein HPY55_12920 [Firmicutes bacterium]|nr:hypothetical protein [Bacillota bacterium]
MHFNLNNDGSRALYLQVADRMRSMIQGGMDRCAGTSQGRLPPAGPEACREVILTSGAQQGVSLVAETLVDPGDVVMPEGIALDSVGRLLRQHRPKIIFVIPMHHNPTGSIMPIENRQELEAEELLRPEGWTHLC